VAPWVSAYLRYDGYIMMSRTQISLDPEIQRRVRQRASQMGISLAEYVRRLIATDLGSPRTTANPAVVFDLGASSRSDIARNKDAMIAEAFASSGGHSRRRRSA